MLSFFGLAPSRIDLSMEIDAKTATFAIRCGVARPHVIQNRRFLTSAGKPPDEIPPKFGGISGREVHSRCVAAFVPLCAPYRQSRHLPRPSARAIFRAFFTLYGGRKGKQDKDPASQAPPVFPHLPAVRAVSGVRNLASS